MARDERRTPARAADASIIESLTDVGNGERFARQHEGMVLHVEELGYRVYEPSTGIWREDEAALMRKAKETARSWYTTAAQTDDDETRARVAKHARSCESAKSLKAMLDMAASEFPLQARAEEFSGHPMLLNVPNGVVDLTDGSLKKHTPALRMTKMAGAPYVPGAKCPRWMRHLERVCGGNRELMDFLQRLAGYFLTGKTNEQVIAIWYGSGANGKSVTIETLRAALGDYALGADFRTFTASKDRGPRSDLARLAGARLVTASEGNEGDHLDEALVKEITGGEPVTSRFLYGREFEYRPQFKVVLSSNHKPEIRGTDHGIWRRILLVPFTETIPESEQDMMLSEKLREELAGILAWAVQGCLKWQKGGLKAPQAVCMATGDYRVEMDTVARFLSEWCVVDAQASVSLVDMHNAYQEWARECGEDEMKARAFGRLLRNHSVKVDGRQGRTGRVLCHGFRLANLTHERQAPCDLTGEEAANPQLPRCV